MESNKAKAKLPRNPSVVVIGAGMTGILSTIKLLEAGITDIIVLEKSNKIGGTWNHNTYPGVACDVPAHLYTYQFERNPGWSNRFAYGDEIQAYFESVSEKYGVNPHVRLSETVTDARYTNDKWIVKTDKGAMLEADFMVCATGILHKPNKPNFAGQEEFEGSIFHTAEWDHDTSLDGKRVVIIGTGSTATQVITELPKKVAKLTVLQRTPQWVFPIPNRKFSDRMKASCAKHSWRISMANFVYGKFMEKLFSEGVTGNKLPHAIMSFFCKRNLKKSVGDPELREKLTPDYKVGCKRLVLNGTFYQAIQKENVELETAGIKRFHKAGIEMENGNFHPADVIILATGFDPAAYMRPMNLFGKHGTSINEKWQHKAQAYRSMFVPEFPNFFLMLGPNTPIGNFNVIQMSEVQVAYMMKLIERWRAEEFDEIDVKPEALVDYNKRIKAGMSKTVWVSGGCTSWYLDADGDPLSWPFSWKQWTTEMAAPEMSDFTIAQTNSRSETIGCKAA